MAIEEARTAARADAARLREDAARLEEQIRRLERQASGPHPPPPYCCPYPCPYCTLAFSAPPSLLLPLPVSLLYTRSLCPPPSLLLPLPMSLLYPPSVDNS